MLKLFCYVSGDLYSQSFKLEIDEAKDVDDLREIIKEKKRLKFADIEADSLLLWNASVQYGHNLREDVEALDLGEPLKPFNILSNISWSGLGEERVNLIIGRPLSGELQLPMYILCEIADCHIEARADRQYLLPVHLDQANVRYGNAINYFYSLIYSSVAISTRHGPYHSHYFTIYPCLS